METARKEIEEYFEKHEVATVPLLQNEFHFGYGKIRTIIDELIQDKIIMPINGIEFRYCKELQEEAEEAEETEDVENDEVQTDNTDGIGDSLLWLKWKLHMDEETEKYIQRRTMTEIRAKLGAVPGEDIDEKDDAIKLKIYYPNYVFYDIALQNVENKYQLTDSGFTFVYLKSKIKPYSKEYANNIKFVLRKYGVMLKNGTLIKSIKNADDALTSLVLLVAAIDGLISLVVKDFDRKKYESRANIMRLKTKSIFILNPEMNRQETIACLEKRICDAQGEKDYEMLLSFYKSISDAMFERAKKKIIYRLY